MSQTGDGKKRKGTDVLILGLPIKESPF